MYNLSTVLESSARKSPDHVAIVFGNRRLTYRELDAAACQVANGLAASGIGAGDVVALACPNLPYFPMAYFGVLKTGATVLPINVLLTPEEVLFLLNDSRAKALMAFEGTPELPVGETGFAAFRDAPGCEHFWTITADPQAASPIAQTKTLGELMGGQKPDFDTVQRSGEDVAVVLYTSGTTGHPKGAELTHTNLVLNAILSRDLVGPSDRDDVCMITLPLFHVFGQVVLMVCSVLAGRTMVLIPRFEPGAVLASLERDDVTIFAGVPTMYWALLHHPSDGVDLARIKRNLRACCCGGASLPVEVLRAFEAKFEVPILEGYGLSETSPVLTFNHIDRERRAGSVGQPVWGVEVRVVDDQDRDVAVGETGEVIARGHAIMKGYLNNPEATAEAMRGGWFHTGDLARFDEDGYLYIVDRLKDMIIRGGFNVYPREVEEVLVTHDDVTLAAVVGVPDEEHGEEVKAFVVPKPGHSIDADGLIAWSKQYLAAYKYPRIVEVRDSLPMNATGKILKKDLR
jgi:long-chain acyl-CoA synthetase